MKTDRLSRLRVSEERFFKENRRNLDIDIGMVNLRMTDSEIGHTTTETDMGFNLCSREHKAAQNCRNKVHRHLGLEEGSENGVVQVSYFPRLDGKYILFLPKTVVNHQSSKTNNVLKG